MKKGMPGKPWRCRSPRVACAVALLLPLARVAAGQPIPAVVVAQVRVQNSAPATVYTGRVQAIQSVTFTARVQAFVEKIDFAEGGLVKPGQILFELQAAPYQAALDGAQASLSKAIATQKGDLGPMHFQAWVDESMPGGAIQPERPKPAGDFNALI